MLRFLTVCTCALVAILLLTSDANAFGRRRGGCYGGCGGFVTVGYYGGCYGGGYGGYGGWNGCYGGYGGWNGCYGGYAAPAFASGYAPAYGGGYGWGGYSGYGWGGRGYGYRYNPGGLGGPRSGLGVRPGLGFGGFGLRR
jgi:hypothetical protein